MSDLIEAVKAYDIERVKSFIESEIVENNKKTLKIIYKLINGIVFSGCKDTSNGENYFLIKQDTIEEIFTSSDVEISKLLIQKGFLFKPLTYGVFTSGSLTYDIKRQIIKNENIELLKVLINEITFCHYDLEYAKEVGNKEIIKIIVDSQIKPLETKIQSLEEKIQSLKQLKN
jgi:hypothetical protein